MLCVCTTQSYSMKCRRKEIFSPEISVVPLVQSLVQRKSLHNEFSEEYDYIGVLIDNHFQFLLLEMTVGLPLQEKW